MRRTFARYGDFWRDVRRGRKSAVRTQVAIAGIAVLLLGTLAFFTFGHVVATGATRELDESIVSALRNRDDPAAGWGPRWLNGGARDITAFGSVTVVTLVSLAAVGAALLQRDWRLAALFVVAAAGGAILNTSLKELYARPRPSLPLVVPAANPSFPSGHAMLSASVYLSLAVVLALRRTRRAVQVYVVSLAGLLTILVGASRVYLGVHYPTDVLAGWLAGILWAVLCGLASWSVGQRS
jgi:undecaprenyl-diphosphatase